MFRHLLIAPALGGAMLVGALAGPAAAAPPRELTGTAAAVSATEQVVVRTAGPAVFTEFSNVNELAGDIQGLASASYSCVQVGMVQRCRGTQQFEGTVLGFPGPGRTDAVIRFACDLSTGLCTGSTVTTASSGGLEGLHAFTSFTTQLLPGGGGLTTYTSRVTGPAGA